MKLFFFRLQILAVFFFLLMNVKSNRLPVTLANFLKGKVKERGLSCLIEVLEKVNNLGFEAPGSSLDGKIREGVTQAIDITTMLLQFSHLSALDQVNIIKCHLTMDMAKQRCQNVYGHDNCEIIKWSEISTVSEAGNISKDAIIPYVSRKCLFNYKRQGCCKCLRKCTANFSSEETLGDKDIHNYCLKHESYESKISKGEGNEDLSTYQPFGDSFIEKCKDGYTRVGAKLCVARCPLGWPDLGDRCMKTGDIILMPFVWMVGDDSMAAMLTKTVSTG